MKKIRATFLVMIVIVAFTVSCTHKGNPTIQGDLLTAEQIKTLKNDQSMNGKLVSIEGYASFCGSFSSVTGGKKGKMKIYTDGFCKGEKLIDAKIMFSNGSIPLSGEEKRNQAIAENSFTNETLQFTTDEYQDVPNGKLKFSGKVVYNGKDYYLDNITIHK